MAEIRQELLMAMTGLEAASAAAVGSLGLTPGEFVLLRATTFLPMGPDFQPGDMPEEYGSCASKVNLYGGRAFNVHGDYGYGHIQAQLIGPTPDGAMHTENPRTQPVPYITRKLTVKDGKATLFSSSVNPAMDGAPLIINTRDGEINFVETNTYNSYTGGTAVQGGEVVVKHGKVVSRRITMHNAFDLPDDVYLARFGRLATALAATAHIFTHLVTPGDEHVTYRIR